jgi:opacity protein-like surface antigen/outer membrane receptor protein involved in Fe transport
VPTSQPPTAVPSAPAATGPTQTQTFNEHRDNIFAPVGTAPTTWSREDIEGLPAGTNTPLEKALLQFPGVSQDSSIEGNFHVRNEHLESSLAFRINGILLPDTIGAFGGAFLDTSFIGSLSLITGALPAQYGFRTVGVVDIKTATFGNSGQIGVYGGSRETGNYSIQYGGKTGSTEYFFAGRFLQNILGISNPTPLLNAVHDRTSQDRSFAYISTIIDPTTRLSFIGGTATNSYQIPNIPGQTPSFTAFGITYFPSALVDETQVEKYKFGVLALQKSVNDLDLQLAYFTRTSSVQFTPDLVGDLMFNGVATNVYRGSVANGVQADSAFRMSEAHTLRAGAFASMEKTTVSTVNELLPIDSVTGVQISDVPFPAIDTSVLLGWLAGVYVADKWKLTDRLTLNTGMRFDQMWQYVNANQLSPRISLTYRPFDSTTFHAGFARNFTPPAQVIAAPANTALFSGCPAPLPPNCTTVQAPSAPPPYYLMQPERSNVYDIGVVQKLLPGLELGADVYLKMTRDQINQGQFGAAVVLNGFQYERGLNSGVELKAVYTNGDLRAYANLAWASQRGNNVVTNQYLLGADELAYTRNNWVYADHSQQWTGSGGVSYFWYGTRFSADFIYGSGLRAGFANTDHVPPYAQVNAGMSHEFDVPGWKPVTLRFDVVNVFDTSYVLKNGTGIGVFANAYGPRRGYYLGLAQKFGPGAAVKKPAPATRWVSSHAGESIWTWTGFYMGGHVGYGSSSFGSDMLASDNMGNPLFATSFSTKHVGALGGAQVGYNWQHDIWVAGFETDITFQHYRTTTGFLCPGEVCNPTVAGFDAPVSLIQQHNLDWFGTLRGRLGVAVTPNALAYVTGGLAYGEIEHLGLTAGYDGAAPNDAASTFASRVLRAGWTAGAGIEMHLAGNVTGKIEYLHTDFGFDKALAIFPQNATPLAVDYNSRITQDLVRIGINYKFDPYVRYAVAGKPAAGSISEAISRPRMIYKAPVALWSWTGFYFGANAGYATGKFATDTVISSLGTPLLATSSSSRLNGGIGGAQSGYNWQSDMWLAGVEADVQFSTRRVSAITQCPGAICNASIDAFGAPVTLATNHSLDWFATVRGRLGAAVTPGSVVYFTGGLAIGAIAQSGTISGIAFNAGNPFLNPMDFTHRMTKTALAVGGGLETRLAGNVTGKVEYLHMDFGNASTLATNTPDSPPIAVNLNSRFTNDIVRLGINYKFDPNAEAPASQPARSAAVYTRPIIVKDPTKGLWTWTGYYLGINAGYGWGKSNTDAFFNDNTIPASFATSSSFQLKGELLGLQTGYNFQFGSWVWGVEADAQLSAQRNNPKFVCPGTICNPAGPVIASFDQDQLVEWFGTLRARFGAAVTQGTLVYATGGPAVAGLVTAGNIYGFDPNGNAATNPFKNITINAGWTVGGGVEAHLCGDWTGKIEYLYLNLGSMTTGLSNQQVMALTAAFNSRITDQLVRAGINYKFD